MFSKGFFIWTTLVEHMCILVSPSPLYEKENVKRKAEWQTFIARGIQGKRRVNGSICELKVNPRKNQQRESRARPPTLIFKEGLTNLRNFYILIQGLFSSTFMGEKTFK